MFDYIIIGSGFAGSVAAERLSTEANKKILIIEKRNHIAGNCFDYKNENNILIHKYGPHLFHTSNQKVWDYLSNFTEWQIYHHKVLAFIDGQKVPVLFNLNTLYKLFPTSTAKKLEEKLLENFPFNSKIPILELKQSNDSDLIFLADFVYDKIFLNYTGKPSLQSTPTKAFFEIDPLFGHERAPKALTSVNSINHYNSEKFSPV
ncbi:NAD(P)-binding protein [Sulfuricurvum sp.]|uniref:NAD(P)-binding protein n=1 Tax=Sulfuricurvum sp. TaxID=2025608 RepID=UPI002D5B62BA|nr:NAD(P)-binding protein [Sulfuricurvum sp.]HZF71587.1 NAD(P)-binding protein [Sulfuricurvum sp.]